MKKTVATILLSLGLLATTASAAKWHVDIDVSSLAGDDIGLEFAMYNTNGVDNDSAASVDNVFLDGILHDFEPVTVLLDDWYSLTPGSLDPQVTIESGTINGAGLDVMQIAEAAGITPVLATTDFSAITGPTLSFDLDTTSLSSVLDSGAGGTVFDQLVVTIYDWSDFSGNSDFEAVYFDKDGPVLGANTTVTPIPAPSALILGIMGLSALSAARRRRMTA